MAITQECCEQYWTSPGGNTPQATNYTITKTIQVRRTRHAGHCWRSRDELISDVLLWAHTYGRAKAGRTYIQQLFKDRGCCPKDLPEAMNDREKWRERVTTWWWWNAYTYDLQVKCWFVILGLKNYSFFFSHN